MNNLKTFFDHLSKKIKDKNSFTYGISWTFSATTLSFLLQLIFSPVLSRIYGPEAYGEFAIFNIIVTNLATFSTLAYPQALLTKSQKNEFYSLSLFILLSTLFVLLITSAIFFPFKNFWFDLFPNIGNFSWFPIVIPTVMLYSINEIFSKWNIKRKRYDRNAKYGFAGQLFSKFYAVAFGLKISNSGIGIISSEVFKSSWNTLFLMSLKQKKRIFFCLLKISKKDILKSIIEAKKAINYPKFIWPGNWLNMFSNQLPVLFFMGFFSLEQVGAFTFAGSLIAIPVRLIGNAIRPVFFQKSQELFDRNQLRTLIKFTSKISIYLFLIGLPVFLLIILFGSQIFEFVFGDNWRLSGKVASYMAVVQIAAFSVSPVSSLFLILKKEKKLFHFQIFLFTLRISSLFIGIFLDMDFLEIVLLYSLTNFIAYFVLHILVYKLIR